MPLKTHLKNVSRSFYLSLAILPSGARDPMGIGYLFCRMADTIADLAPIPREEKLEVLTALSATLLRFPNKLEDWGPVIPALDQMPAIAPKEDRLLHQFREILSAFFKLTPADQACIQKVAHAVIQGMIMDLKNLGDSKETLNSLKEEKDLERYIGWIGGEPGNFWTDISFAHAKFPRSLNRDRLRRLGFEFGTGLQMVNILRDLPRDLEKGRCYIPEDLLNSIGLSTDDLFDQANNPIFLPLYHRLIEQTILRLEKGKEYLKQLPRFAIRLKLAVWWPLSLGLSTLSLLRTSSQVLDPKKFHKVSRALLYETIATSPLIVVSHRLIDIAFEDLASEGKDASPTDSATLEN